MNQQSINSFKFILKNCLFILLISSLKFKHVNNRILQASTNSDFSNHNLKSSIYGGTYLYLIGTNFDIESLNNQIKIGNINCNIDFQTITKKFLKCQIPIGKYNKGIFEVEILVKGIKQESETNLVFEFEEIYSPIIKGVVPQTVVPGQIVFIFGVFKTKDYKNFLSIRYGNNLCEILQEDNEFESISYDYLDFIRCRISEDSQIGSFKLQIYYKESNGITFALQSSFGYDYSFSVLVDQTYNIKVVPRIDSISPSEGFISGNILTIKGNGFQFDKDDFEIKFDDLLLEIISINNNEIICRLNEIVNLNQKNIYLGSAGLKFQSKNSSSQFFSEIFDEETNIEELYLDIANDVLVSSLHSTEFRLVDSKSSTRLSGVFIPEISGNHIFYVSTTSSFRLLMSSSKINEQKSFSSSDLSEVCSSNNYYGFRHFYRYGLINCQTNLIQNEQYFFVFEFINLYNEGSVSLGLQSPHNNNNNKHNTSFQILQVRIENQFKREIIHIIVKNASSGFYKIVFPQEILISNEESSKYETVLQKMSLPISFDSSENQMKIAIEKGTNWTVQTISKIYIDSNGIETQDIEISVGIEYTIQFFNDKEKSLPPIIQKIDLSPNSASVESQRIQEATDNIYGSFILKLGDEIMSEQIFYYDNDIIIERKLMKLSEFSNGVTVQGYGNIYDGKHWYIFLDSYLSNSKTLQIHENNLKGGLTGNPAVSVLVMRNASNNLFSLPIDDSFFKTFHSNPQITVKVKGYNAACNNQNCGYSLITSENIPKIDSYQFDASSNEITFQISNYSNFDFFETNDSTNFEIKIGQTPCLINEFSLPEIKCSFETDSYSRMLVEAGKYVPEIYLKDKGFFLYKNEKIELIFDPIVESISPDNGSFNGGTLIRINGSHFSDSIKNIILEINSQTCEIIEVSIKFILCITPKFEDLDLSDDQTEISLNVNERQWIQNVNDIKFFFSENKDLEINNITPKKFAHSVPQNLKIEGINFGNKISDIKIIFRISSNQSSQNIKDFSACKYFIYNMDNSEINLILFGCINGEYQIIVNRSDFGDSLSNNSSNNRINIFSVINSVTPNFSSIEGNQKITILGEGFPHLSNYFNIFIGDENHSCEIKTLSKNSIECLTPPSRFIDNLTQEIFLKMDSYYISECSDDTSNQCKLHYDLSKTPIITDIEIQKLTGIDKILLTFENISTINETSKFNISCDFIEFTNFSIFSTSPEYKILIEVPDSAYSNCELKIQIEGFGSAKFNSEISNKLQIDFEMINIFPKTGSVSGQKISILGRGFLNYEHVKIIFDQNQKECKITNRLNNLIECLIYDANFQMNLENNIEVWGTNEEDFSNSSTINISTCTDCSYTANFNNYEIITVQSNNMTTLNWNLSGHDFSISNIEFFLIDTETFQIHKGLRNNGNSSSIADITFININCGIFDLVFYEPTKGFFINSIEELKNIKILPTQPTFSNYGYSYNGGANVILNGDILICSKDDLFEIKICGNVCFIKHHSLKTIECSSPKFVNKESFNSFTHAESKKQIPKSISTSSESFDVSNLNKNIENGFDISEKNCFIKYDFGSEFVILVKKLKIHPTLNFDTNEFKNLKFEGGYNDIDESDENITWIDINFEMINLGFIWLEIDFDEEIEFRHFRIFNSNKCQISYFEIYGIKLNKIDNAFNLQSHFCDISIFSKYLDQPIILPKKFEYRNDRTSIVTSINPEFINLSGPQEIEFYGNHLDPNGSISINNETCLIKINNSNSNLLVCNINKNLQSQILSIKVEHQSNGLAILPSQEIHVGLKLSEFLKSEGNNDFIIFSKNELEIKKGGVLLFDLPELKIPTILVYGTLLFDDSIDIVIEIENIFVFDEGKFLIGSQNKEHQSKVYFNFYENLTTTSYIGYDKQKIFVDGGEISIFGKTSSKIWTFLDSNVEQNETVLILSEHVDWSVGDEIMITSSSLLYSETETNFVKNILFMNEKTNIELEFPLKHKHFAKLIESKEIESFIGSEVGLISRNIIMQSNDDSGDGLDLMVLSDSNKSKIKISSVQFNNLGKEKAENGFGIHFFYTRNMKNSFIKNSSILNSKNKGIVLQDVQNLHIENNILYNIKGNGIELSDGSEMNNFILSNLISLISISSKTSVGNLNPSGIYLSNLENTIKNNSISSSQHSGIEINLSSFTKNFSRYKDTCPSGIPNSSLFASNIIHSNKFGIRIYPEFIPRSSPCSLKYDLSLKNLWENNEPVQSSIKNTIIFANEVGIHLEKIGALQIFDLRMYSNQIQLRVGEPNQSKNFQSRIEGAIFVGYSELSQFHLFKTDSMMLTPRRSGFFIKDAYIIDYKDGVLFRSCERCSFSKLVGRGGSKLSFQNVSCENVNIKTFEFVDAEKNKPIFYDDDGSFIFSLFNLNFKGGWIVPFQNHLQNENCNTIDDSDISNQKLLVCNKDIDILTLSISADSSLLSFKNKTIKIFQKNENFEFNNNIEEENLFGQHSYISSPSDSNFEGFTFNVITKEKYNIHWENNLEWENLEIENNSGWISETDEVILSFNFTLPRMTPNVKTSIAISQEEKNLYEIGKHVYFETEKERSDSELKLEENNFGDYFYDENKKYFEVKIDSSQRGKISVHYPLIKQVNGSSSGSNIEFQEQKYSELPEKENNLIVSSNINLILDIHEIDLESLIVEGKLSIDEKLPSIKLNTKFFEIKENAIFEIGSANSHYENSFTLNMSDSSQNQTQNIQIPNISIKNGIVVKGNLNLFGKNNSNNENIWTYLIKTVEKGTNELYVEDTKLLENWEINDHLIISSSSKDFSNFEIVEIKEIYIYPGKVILKENLKYSHFGSYNKNLTSKGKELEIRTEVGNMKRNILIKGTESNGCSIIIPEYINENETISGKINFQSVMIQNCGNMQNEFSALHFITNNSSSQNVQSISNSVFLDNYYTSINLHRSSYISINNNIFVDSMMSGILIQESSDIYINQNLIIGIRKPNILNKKGKGIEIISLNSLIDSKIELTKNRISSVQGIGITIPPFDCSNQNFEMFFEKNVIHSCFVGIVLEDFESENSNSKCYKLSNFLSFKNKNFGLFAFIISEKLIISNVILVDNTNSIYLSIGNSSEVESKVEIEDIEIINDGYNNCLFCTNSEIECSNTGIQLPIFEKRTENLSYDLINFDEVLRSDVEILPLKSSFTIKNSNFINFDDSFNLCFESENSNNEEEIEEEEGEGSEEGEEGKSSYSYNSNLFSQTQIYSENIPQINFSNIQYISSSKDKLFKFEDFYNINTQNDFCSDKKCTSKQNILFDDTEGNFFGNHFQYLPNNIAFENQKECNLIEDWSGFICSPIFGHLTIYFGEDSIGKIVSPVKITSSNDFTNKIIFEHQISSIIKLNEENFIEFMNKTPKEINLKLSQSQIKVFSILKVKSNLSSNLILEKNKTRIKNEIYIDSEKPDFSKSENQKCGKNYFNIDTNEMVVFITSEEDCNLKIKHTNSIKFIIRIDIEIEDWITKIGEDYFVEQIQTELDIPSNQIRLIKILNGSTILVWVIDSDKSIEEEDEILIVNEKLTKLKEKLENSINQGEVELGGDIISFISDVSIFDENFNSPDEDQNDNSDEKPFKPDIDFEETKSQQKVQIILGICIPLVLIFLLVFIYAVCVYKKNKRVKGNSTYSRQFSSSVSQKKIRNPIELSILTAENILNRISLNKPQLETIEEENESFQNQNSEFLTPTENQNEEERLLLG